MISVVGVSFLFKRKYGRNYTFGRVIKGGDSITVKVNSVVIPGINEAHLPLLAQKMGRLGVDLMNLLPLIPVPGTALEDFAPPPAARMHKLRQKAGASVPQMHHCTRCRSDAVGLLCKDIGSTSIRIG